MKTDRYILTADCLNCDGNEHAGFTLLEILVAMSILVIIVLLLTQMFHQSSIAWDSGMRKVDINMETRAVLSVMSMELTQAVGDEILPLDMHNGSQIYFYTLKSASQSNRAVERVVYQWNGDTLLRAVTTIQPQQSPYPVYKSTLQSTFLTNCVNLEFAVPPGGPYTTNLPLWLDVRVGARRQSTSLAVAVNSMGPDRALGTQDDIYSTDGGK